MHFRIAALVLLVSSLFACLLPENIHAQEEMSEGFAFEVQLDERNIPEGSIITLSKGKYLMSDIPYDPSVLGVVTDNPAISFSDTATTNTRPVTSVGKVKTRVTTINGQIKPGDLITTSPVKGAGQKATENGYVIGVALENYENADASKVGSIYVSLHLNFGILATTVRQNLLATIRRGVLSPFISPLSALRYIVAGAVALISFLGGFWFFGRVSSRGVEAIGRNPLARRFIIISVLMNVTLTIVVMLFGVAIAYVILVI